jgi:SAM-dependent methyltransferase
MDPAETGRAYDAIAAWWDAGERAATTGLDFLRSAVRIAPRGRALDVGCGTGGRMIEALQSSGYSVTGVDVSPGMLAFARRRHPGVDFFEADIATWSANGRFELVLAWDSIFHIPRAAQAAIVGRLCDLLADGGVLLFTAGGVDSEIRGEMAGQTFGYGSLADVDYLRILGDRGCSCVLMQRDQYPEVHLVIIAQKV